jgi:cell division septation protein DedD
VNGRPLTSRDYKRARAGRFGFNLARARDISIGLAVGLCAAGLVYLSDHRTSEGLPELLRPTPAKADAPDTGAVVHAHAGSAVADAAGDAAAGDAVSAAGERKYDFYKMLPKFEVVVPEKERGTQLAPAAQIDRPGIYFLQIGSYRDTNTADRVHAQLGKLGIDTTVQRVAVDSDVWYRVRIGPVRDLHQLNRLRQQLRASDFDSLVIRVDD